MADGPSAREQGSRPLPKDSDWLLPFLPALRERGRRLLEPGCGPGIDASTLTAAGFEVVAFDWSPVSQAAVSAPAAWLLRADLGRTLPFRDAVFDGAVSSLALHYLPWAGTRLAFSEIRRVLKPGAPFLFRVNATDDYAHGAGEGEEVEPNFYRAGHSYYSYFSENKRFFDEAAVRAAVEGWFAVEHLEHRTIYRYQEPKRAWECLARAV